MGAPKQKWTSEEEGALRKGVEKYGAGRWRTIQKDPEFGVCLAARSNVDLKDKWRNMSVSASGHGSRDRIRTPKKALAAVPLQSLTPEATPTLAIEAADSTTSENPVSSKILTNGRTSPTRYEEFIIEALTALQDQNGNDVRRIANYIEERHVVPTNLKRLLTAKLRRLVAQDKIVKVGHNFKLKDKPYTTDVKPVISEFPNQSANSIQHSSATSDIIDASTNIPNGASMDAAKKVAEAEEMSAWADEAVRESEYATRVAEESDMLMEAASAILEQFLQDGVIILS